MREFWKKFHSFCSSTKLFRNRDQNILKKNSTSKLNSTTLNNSFSNNKRLLRVMKSWNISRKFDMLNWICLYTISFFIQSTWFSKMMLNCILKSYVRKFNIHCMKSKMSRIMNRFIIFFIICNMKFFLNKNWYTFWLKTWSISLNEKKLLTKQTCWMIIMRLILITTNKIKKYLFELIQQFWWMFNTIKTHIKKLSYFFFLIAWFNKAIQKFKHVCSITLKKLSSSMKSIVMSNKMSNDDEKWICD